MTASQTQSSEQMVGFQGPNAIEASWPNQKPRYVMFAQDAAKRDQFVAFGGRAGRVTFMVRAPWSALNRLAERAWKAGAEIVRMEGYPKSRAIQVVPEGRLTRDDVLPASVAKKLKRLQATFRRDAIRLPAAPASTLVIEDGGSISPSDTGTQPPVSDVRGAFASLSTDGSVVAA